MPLKMKKTYKKKAYKKKAFKRVGAPSEIRYYDNNRLNPYPRRYITKVHSSVYGAFPPGSPVGNFSVNVIGKLPYAGSGLPSGTVPNVSTLGATGFNNMCNASFYRFYKVTGWKITIEFLPQTLGDSVIASLTPSLLSTLPANTQTALTQPFTKKGNFSSSKSNTNSKRGNAITMSMKCHDFLGVNKMIYDNALDTNFSAQYNLTPLRPIFVVGNWQTLDNVILQSNLEYRLDLTQYIQFYEQDTANLNQIAPN